MILTKEKKKKETAALHARSVRRKTRMFPRVKLVDGYTLRDITYIENTEDNFIYFMKGVGFLCEKTSGMNRFGMKRIPIRKMNTDRYGSSFFLPRINYGINIDLGLFLL